MMTADLTVIKDGDHVTLLTVDFETLVKNRNFLADKYWIMREALEWIDELDYRYEDEYIREARRITEEALANIVNTIAQVKGGE